jgi:anti-sigma regulatory factor (Ser/Thr protein kinase)
MKEAITIRIEVPADLMLLRPLDAFVRRFIEQRSDIATIHDLVDDLELVFNEAFMNIHDHAYRSRENGPVWIRIVMSTDRLEFWFEDEGEGFDAEKSQDHFPEATVERGRGVWLIRHFMDEFSYSLDRKGRNVLRLVKHFSSV